MLTDSLIDVLAGPSVPHTARRVHDYQASKKMNTDTQRAILLKVTLVVGFLAFAAGVATAYTQPTTGYEVSIYWSTPLGYWIGVSLATLIALVVAFTPTAATRLRGLAMALATSSVISVIGLPLIRSYHYYGSGDSLSHLGWAREIGSGVLSPFGLLYPTIHIGGNFIADLSGFGLTRTMQFMPLLVYPLIGVIFTVLCVRYLTDSRWAIVVGLFAGLLFIPINKLSVHVVAHPSSQAIMFLPLVLYLAFRFVTEPTDRFAFATPIGVALAVAAGGMIFIHPQEGMSLTLLIGSVAVIQHLYRRFKPNHRISSHQSLLPHALLTGLVFLTWVPQHSRPADRVGFVIQSIRETGGTTGEETTTRADSLAALGGGVEELFVKLFLVTLLFCILAAILMLANLAGRLDERTPDRNALITYLTVGLVPLALVFAVVFIADQGDHYFRFMGVIMVPVTIIGAAALAELLGNLELSVSRTGLAAGVVSVFVVMMAMQGMVLHESPYMYQGNKQVTEGAMEGYTTTFDHRMDETEFVSFRKGERRYIDAYFGRETAREINFPGYRSGVEGPVFNENISTHYDDDTYLTLHQSRYDVEVGLYNELRYTDEGFQQLETKHNIYRLQDNGDYTLHLIRSGD